MTRRIQPHIPIDSPWLTAAEAAAYARTNIDEITAACRNGALVAGRRGERGQWRIHRDDLDSYLDYEIRGIGRRRGA